MMAAAAAIMGKALHRGHRAATKKENGKGNQVATVNLKPGLDIPLLNSEFWMLCVRNLLGLVHVAGPFLDLGDNLV